MPKALDTARIAAAAIEIEKLKALIVEKNAELARLCGLPAEAGAEPAARKPRKQRARPNVLPPAIAEQAAALAAQPSVAEQKAALDRAPVAPQNDLSPQKMPGHDPDRTDPAQEDKLGEVPSFLRRGGPQSAEEKAKQAEAALAAEETK